MTDTEKMTRVIETSKENWGYEPHVIDGVEFWMVGRNSSHQFYIGKLGFAILVYSIGEGASDPLSDDYLGDEEHMTAYQSFEDMDKRAYLGHL